MKPALALVAVLTLTAPALAESRSVLVVVTHDKDGKAIITVHSDDKVDRREATTVDEACKAVAGMKGWGSVVSVYVVIDHPLSRKNRKALFDAIDANAWLNLSYYGPEAPKNLADYFLKPKPVPAPAKPPAAEPMTKVDRTHAERIALAHLNIEKPAKDPAFTVRVTEDKLTRDGIKELDDPRHGITKHKDLAGLPDTIPVFTVHVSQGLTGDSTVFVAKEGGRVVLVKYVPEG
jgi:hypothetical protein